MKIRDIEVPVDVRMELEQFDFENARWEKDKLICSSPFRSDNNASFFVRLEPFMDFPEGIWSDSGGMGEWASGSFPRLLAFLKGISVDEAEEFLLEVYGDVEIGYKEKLTLRLPRLHLEQAFQTVDEQLIDDYLSQEHSYLESRGIPLHIQKELGIGYSPKHGAVTFVWRDGNGIARNCKYRSTESKVFWYEKGCTPISQLIYNIDYVYKHRPKTIAITEAEIDAAYLQQIIPAVALGGSNFSDKKADILRKAPYENIIIAVDNDRIGAKMRDLIDEKLRDFKTVYHLSFPKQYKDVNDIKSLEELKGYFKKSKKYKKEFKLKLL